MASKRAAKKRDALAECRVLSEQRLNAMTDAILQRDALAKDLEAVRSRSGALEINLRVTERELAHQRRLVATLLDALADQMHPVQGVMTVKGR